MSKNGDKLSLYLNCNGPLSFCGNMESAPPTCRHEYVRIYQRKLKGLERRLVATKAWLPVGFKQADFSHLGEGSYCFCTKCRARLYPKRTTAEKAAARQALAAAKEAALSAVDNEIDLENEIIEETVNSAADVNVEELEIEAVQLEELETTVAVSDEDEACQLADTD